MADASKEDLKRLTEELHRITEQLTDAKHQLSTLADRADRAEKFHEKVEPNMWFVTGAKWFVGVFSLTILVGVVSFAFSFGSLNSDVKHHSDEIKSLIQSLEKLAESNRQANERLVQLIIDRFPPKIFGSASHEGKLVKVSKDEVVIETAEPEKKRLSFKLTPETMIFLQGKQAKPTDLKMGMLLQVTEGEKGKAEQINALAH
jgi:hypothetical protein